MPLSEREQRILQEIEKDLYDEDPRFARDADSRTPRIDGVRRIKLGALLFVLGFAVLIAFFVSRSLIVGVAAFGAMVTGIVLLAGSVRSLGTARSGLPGQRDRLVHKFEEWEARMRNRYKRS